VWSYAYSVRGDDSPHALLDRNRFAARKIQSARVKINGIGQIARTTGAERRRR